MSSTAQCRFLLPPVIECTTTLEKCDSFESSQSTADTTLIPSSSFSNETSPSSALRQRGTPTQSFELPTIVEKASRKRRLIPPIESHESNSRTKWMIFSWTILFVLLVGLVGYSGLFFASSELEALPSEMERHLWQSRILQHRPGGSFTIRLKGSNLIFLRNAINRYLTCSGVGEIQIDWTDANTPFAASFFTNPKVAQASDKTLKGILLLDETVVLSCDDIHRGFYEWRKDPTRAVGFFPLLQKDSSYSLLSDRALFLHRSYLSLTSSTFRDECQEWVLAARVSAISQKHAVAMAWTAPRVSTYYTDPSCYSLISHALPDLPSADTIFIGGLK